MVVDEIRHGIKPLTGPYRLWGHLDVQGQKVEARGSYLVNPAFYLVELGLSDDWEIRTVVVRARTQRRENSKDIAKTAYFGICSAAGLP